MSTIIEIVKRTRKVLGQLAQQSLVPFKKSSISFYTILTLILRQPHCVGLMGPIPPFSRTMLGQSAQYRHHPLSQWGDTAPYPLLWQGGGHSLWQFCHPCWANCWKCSITLPKTAVRGGVKIYECVKLQSWQDKINDDRGTLNMIMTKNDNHNKAL